MSSIGNMKVGARLTLGFAVLLLLLLGITALGLTRLSGLNEGTQAIVTDAYPKVEMANAVIDDLNVLARGMRNVVIFSEQETIQKELDRMVGAKATIEANLAKIATMVRSEKGKALFKAINEAGRAYAVQQDEFVKLAAAGK